MSTSLDHTIDEELGRVPATLSEEQENLAQITKLRERTYSPGIMRLRVDEVATTENSGNWAFDVLHPVDGELRIFFDKPRRGWTDEYELVKMLEWYGLADPYEFQTTSIFMQYNGADSEYNHGWDPIRSPEYELSTRQRVREYVGDRRETVGTVSDLGWPNSYVDIWLILATAVAFIPVLYYLTPLETFALPLQVITVVCLFVFSSAVAMAGWYDA